MPPFPDPHRRPLAVTGIALLVVLAIGTATPGCAGGRKYPVWALGGHDNLRSPTL